MPTYKYRCKECGHELEEFQQITAEPITECPKCGRKSLARILGSGGGIIFKGSGFYHTDYKKEGEKKKEPKSPESGEKTKDVKPGTSKDSGSGKEPDAGKKDATKKPGTD